MSLLAQDQQLTRRVGAVTLVLLALSIGFFVFIYDQIEWGSPVRVRVYFSATGGLQEGAPFIVAGRTIGHIESIALSPRGAVSKSGAPTPLAGEEGVVVTLTLDREAAEGVTKGGDVFVTSHGALSSRFIELGPPPGPGPRIADGDEFRGNDPPSLDRVLERTWNNLTTARRFIEEVRPEANALGAELDKLQATLLEIAPEILFRAEFSDLVDEARRTYTALGGDPGIARARSLRDHADTTLGEARASIAKLREGADLLGASLEVLRARMGGKGVQAIEHIEQAIDRVKAAIAKIDPLLAQIDDIQQRIERGEGSLLKLARDPEFPEDAKELGKILKRQPWRILDRPTK